LNKDRQLKISIITVVFNNAKTILDSIKSLQFQSYELIEHIIVDGQSSDGTLEIIKKNINKNTVLISEPDNGLYYALNKGLEAATGDVIGILHSDDFFADKDVLLNVAKHFLEGNADILYGNIKYVDYKNTAKVVRHWKSNKFLKKNLYFGWMPPHPSVFIKRKLIKECGNYNTQYKISSDYDFMIRILLIKGTSVLHMPKTLVLMRVGGESNRNLKNIIKKSIEDYKIIKKNKIGGVVTLLTKNLSKINQFFLK
jgi:glycosyltransferase